MSIESSDAMYVYIVVVNHEEQYSIWLQDREIPLGWSSIGVSGSKEACLRHIGEVWTDMRPLSLRKQMESRAGEDRNKEVVM